MWDKVQSLANTVQSQVNHMERQHWILAFTVVVVVGFMCMRGFGSRTNY